MVTFQHVGDYKLEQLRCCTLPDGMRVYQGKKQWYPSVTTVTGWSKRKFFEEWRKDPKNQDTAIRTRNRGNEFHDMFEEYLNNEDWYGFGRTDNTKRLFEQARLYVDKHVNRVHAVEAPLYSDTLGLAGRVDLVAEWDKELSIIDFKGSDKEKKEEWIENYFLQSTAYALMWEERTKFPIDQIVIIVACETGITQIFKKNPKDYVKQLYEAIQGFHNEFEMTEVQREFITDRIVSKK